MYLSVGVLVEVLEQLVEASDDALADEGEDHDHDVVGVPPATTTR
jgi:hypothetical protein